MRKSLSGFIFLTVLVSATLAQDNWNRYSWGTPGREGFTVLLPTIPEQIANENGEQGISAFIDFVTYKVTFKDGVSKQEFDKQVTDWQRLVGRGNGSGTTKEEVDKELNLNLQTREISVCDYSWIKFGGYSGIEFGNSNSVQQFFLVDSRLYHVWVTGADKSNPGVAKFLKSFTLINPWERWKGIRTNEAFDDSEFSTGSGATFESSVCRNIGKTETKKSAAKLTRNSPLRLISKPQAKYPEEAKKNGVQGTVSLRVTFLKDGSIGEITVVKGINKKMDESAINAAKLIKFEPQRKGGKFVTITKTIEYNFAIY